MSTTLARPRRPVEVARGGQPPPPLRPRALLLGTILTVPNAYWIVFVERVGEGPYPTTIALFLNALFWLVLLIAANALVRRARGEAWLTAGELLAVYTMLCIGSAFAGLDMVPSLVQMMAYPSFNARQDPSWAQTVLPYVPAPLIVGDANALTGYYIGNSSLYRWEHLMAWLMPIAFWLVFIFLLWWTMLCTASLVRAQWTDSEKLAFPLVELPVRLVNPAESLWRQRLFLAGIAIGGGINLLNGLHYWYPSIPEIPVKHQDLAPYFTNKPWNAIDWFPISFYPFAIGIGYLLPVDLLFSIWFFYLFWKLELVAVRAWGWDTTPGMPFIREQGIGAYLGIGLFLLFSTRGLFRRLSESLRSGEPTHGEALSYRAALWGLAAGVAGLVVFLMAFRMQWWLAVAVVLLYLLMALVITRIRAEFGPPVHDQHFSGPDYLIPRVMGTQPLTSHDLGMLNFFYWFNRAYRSHPMPFALEGLKIAQSTRTVFSSFFWTMLWAGVWGSAASFWAFLHLAYQHGTSAGFFAGQQFGIEAYNRLATWLQSGQNPNSYAIAAVGVGGMVAWGLMLLRGWFSGFLFHPIGFSISGSWAMNLVWFPLLIAWVIKWSVLKWGGLKLYRQALPLFLGLIVGEAIVGMGWSLIGVITSTPTYSFWGQ